MALKEQTKELLQLVKQLRERFENSEPPEKISDHQFFNMMKSETMPIFDLLKKWEANALEFVKDKHVNVHPHQIVSTKENMELIIMHSYYIDARKRRYMELNKSSIYIFDQLLKDIQEKGRHNG